MLKSSRQKWLVVFAGVGINLAFGVLYSWSIFSGSLIDTYGWTQTEASLPYTVAIAVFALMMIPAGKLQSKYGARLIASVSGIFTGTGLILSSFLLTKSGLIVSFGVLAGAGIGLGYASATPAAVKWFPANKKGVVTGIVVAGFGLSTIYMAPLANYLIHSLGLYQSFRVLGIAFLVVVISLAQLFQDPQASQAGSVQEAVSSVGNIERNYHWREMVKTRQFYQLWIVLAAGSLGGLMIIGHLSKIVSAQSGSTLGFLLVAFTVIFNASGRPISGLLSDKIGRSRTLIILFLCEGIVFLAFSSFHSFVTLLFGAAVITYTYGSLFSVIPSVVSDFYGTSNFPLNYGILFSAWGLGGVVGPILAGKIVDSSGGYSMAYFAAAGLCFIAAVTAWTIKPTARSAESIRF